MPEGTIKKLLAKGFGFITIAPVPKRKDFTITKLTTISAILLFLVATLHAADKSPNQVLGGKPAATSSGSNEFYDGRPSIDNLFDERQQNR